MFFNILLDIRKIYHFNLIFMIMDDMLIVVMEFLKHIKIFVCQIYYNVLLILIKVEGLFYLIFFRFFLGDFLFMELSNLCSILILYLFMIIILISLFIFIDSLPKIFVISIFHNDSLLLILLFLIFIEYLSLFFKIIQILSYFIIIFNLFYFFHSIQIF